MDSTTEKNKTEVTKTETTINVGGSAATPQQAVTDSWKVCQMHRAVKLQAKQLQAQRHLVYQQLKFDGC